MSMDPPIKAQNILTKGQADGAQELTLSVYDCARLHQIQVELSATPAAGTLTVSVKTPGASSYIDLEHTIDLVNGPYLYQIYGIIEAIQFTPTGLDGDKTYSVYVVSGDTVS